MFSVEIIAVNEPKCIYFLCVFYIKLDGEKIETCCIIMIIIEELPAQTPIIINLWFIGGCNVIQIHTHSLYMYIPRHHKSVWNNVLQSHFHLS